MKAFRSTLVLLLIAAVVGGYIWNHERGPIGEQGAVELLRIEPNSVNAVELRAGKSRLKLAKNGGAWTIAKPQMTPVPADETAVKTLLQPLTLLQSDAVVPQGVARLKEYGLDAPRAVLNVQGRTLEFGLKPSFDAARVYARVGDQVALVPASLLAATSQGFGAWRDTRALPFSPNGVTNFRVKAPGLNAAFSLFHEWNVELPSNLAGTRVDEGVVTSFLNQLSQARAARFLDDQPKSLELWGLNHPVASITIAAGESKRVLLIGKKMSGGYAAKSSSSPAVFVLPGLIFGLMNRPLSSWRAHDILPFEFNDLQKVSLGSRGVGREFIKGADNKWQASKNGTPVAETVPVNGAVLDLLLAAQGLRAQDFVDNWSWSNQAKFGFDDPVFTLNFSEPEAQTSRSLVIGRHSGHLYARLTEQNPLNGSSTRFTIYALAPDALEPFQNGLKALFPTPKKTQSKGKS